MEKGTCWGARGGRMGGGPRQILMNFKQNLFEKDEQLVGGAVREDEMGSMLDLVGFQLGFN